MIVMGLGELGQLYASAALKTGIRVTPLTRTTPVEQALEGLPTQTPLLVAVGEKDLESALQSLPKSRLDSLILLQNELFPAQWERFSKHVTLMIPWLLKKKGEPLLVARSTPVFGQFAPLVEALHIALGFQAEALPDPLALKQAIVDKYAFILSVNALGLVRDLTLAEWLAHDTTYIDALAREAAALGAAQVGMEVRVEQTLSEVRSGLEHMGAMRARGRTAKDRVLRALAHAKHFRISAPAFERAAQAS